MHLSQCPCCQRQVRSIDMTHHHWLPRSLGGTVKETIELCKTCHDVLHYVIDIDNVKKYKTVELLIENEEFAKYIHWIRTISHPEHIKVKRAEKLWLSYDQLQVVG